MRLLLLLATIGIGTAAHADASPSPPAVRGFVVHEWGVWKVKRGELLHVAELARENPTFVRVAPTPTGLVPTTPQLHPVAKKPVLFFYAKQPLHVEVTVQLMGGYPMFHYPPARIDNDLLTFSLDVGAKPRPLRPVPSSHFWATLRGVGANLVSGGGETERFAFYDGPTRLLREFTARAEGTTIVVKRDTTEEVFVTDGTYVSVVGGPAGEAKVAWPPTAPIATLFARLQQRLEQSGLSPAESRAFLDTWRPDLTAKGRRAVALVGRATYDAMLPITFSPPPEAVVRTGVVIDELD